MTYTVGDLLKKMVWLQPLSIVTLIFFSCLIATYHLLLPWQVYSLMQTKPSLITSNHALITTISLFWAIDIVFLLQTKLLSNLKNRLKAKVALLLLKNCRLGQGLPSQPAPTHIMHIPDHAIDLMIWMICHGLTSLLQWSYALIVISQISFALPIYYTLLVSIIIYSQYNSQNTQTCWKNHHTIQNKILAQQNQLITHWNRWPTLPQGQQPWSLLRKLTNKRHKTSVEISYKHLKKQSFITSCSLISHLISCAILFNQKNHHIISFSEFTFALMICYQLNQSLHFQSEQIIKIKQSWENLYASLCHIPSPVGPSLKTQPEYPLPIRLDRVYLNYKKTILHNINLSIKRKSWLHIKGPSGSGKTSLALIISGALKPSQGTVYFNNVELLFQRCCHQKVLYCSTDPKFNNQPLKNFLLESSSPLTHHDKELQSLCLDTNINDLSLGQRQRLQLNTALFNHYDIIILDEALSGVCLQKEIEWLKQLKRIQSAVVYISHRQPDKHIQFDKTINLKQDYKR